MIKIQLGVICIKFWKLAFNVVAELSLDAKLFFKNFENFGTTQLDFIHQMQMWDHDGYFDIVHTGLYYHNL